MFRGEGHVVIYLSKDIIHYSTLNNTCIQIQTVICELHEAQLERLKSLIMWTVIVG